MTPREKGAEWGARGLTLASWTLPFSRDAAFSNSGANFLQWPHLGSKVRGQRIETERERERGDANKIGTDCKHKQETMLMLTLPLKIKNIKHKMVMLGPAGNGYQGA